MTMPAAPASLPAPRALSAGPPQTPTGLPVGRPDFFIVGAPKCGTTALADYLGAHPEIFMARKEMHFFGRDLHFAPHFYRRGEREYLAEFAGAGGRHCLGEASVWYLFSETAAAEIKAFNPAARIIVLLRDPVEMMYSLFRYFRFDGNEPLDSFAEALRVGSADRGSRQTYFAPGLAYRDTARFARQLRRYFAVFGRERVHVVLLEDLIADPARAYRSTLEFLNVAPSFKLAEFGRVNAAKTVRNRAVRAVLNDPAMRSMVLAVRPFLPTVVFRAISRTASLLHRANSSAAPALPLAPELQAELRREFAPEVAELGALLGRDLSHWTTGRRREPPPARESAS